MAARKLKQRVIKRKPSTKRSIQNSVQLSHVDNVIDMNCKECGALVMDVSGGIKAVTCSRCVIRMVDPPPSKIKPEEKHPRGWQFMKRYVSPSGKVYSKGREVDENLPRITKVVGKRAGATRSKKVSATITNSARKRTPKRTKKSRVGKRQ